MCLPGAGGIVVICKGLKPHLGSSLVDMKRIIKPAKRLQGVFKAPGDRSISHRALILGAIARGKQVVDGLTDGDDVRHTAQCLREMGCFVETMPDGRTIILSKEFKKDVSLNAGRSATAANLLAGLVAALPVSATIDGDAVLKSGPIMGLIEPLSAMGARVTASNGGVLPVTIEGGGLKGISHRVRAGEKRVKSAVLIAGVLSEGETIVTEDAPSHDHTEIMLVNMGVGVKRTETGVSVTGESRINGSHVAIPGDFSLALNVMVAAACLPGSNVYLPVTGVNPTRSGILEVLRAMGADIVLENEHKMSGEPAADLSVRHAGLTGTTLDDPALVLSVYDELPALAVAATQAEGTTTVSGLEGHTRRVDAAIQNLAAMGADVETTRDGFEVRGPTRLKGAVVSTFGDHRVAAAMVAAGLIADGETVLDDDTDLAFFSPRLFDDLRTIVR